MIAGVASGICLKVVLCGMGSEKVWFLGSAAMTTKYPLREHVLNTKKQTTLFVLLNTTD